VSEVRLLLSVAEQALLGKHQLQGSARASPALEHLGPEERPHVALVEPAAARLGLQAHHGRVLDRVGGMLACDAALDDALGGPRVHRVRVDLHFERPVGEVLAHLSLPQPWLAGGALQGHELAPPLEHRHHPALPVERRLSAQRTA